MKLEHQVKSGLKWFASVKLIGQLVTWTLTIYVMRLLTPEDYGLVAIATIFITFLILLKEFGLGPAIVQSQEMNQEILKKIFAVLIIISLILVVFIYLVSYHVAEFFNEPTVAPILQVLSLQFFLIPIESIPYALLQKAMKFKKMAIVEVSTGIIGGTATLIFAINGYEVWALVYGNLVLVTCRALLLNLFSPWFGLPDFTNLRSIKKLVTYGGVITLEHTIRFFYTRADTFIVGKILGAKMLGYYSVAMHLSSLPMQRMNSIINQVAFPAFSQIQDDKEKIRNSMCSGIKLTALISFPIFFGLASVAEDGILLVLGQNWSQAILPIMILSLIMPLRMIANLYPTVARSCGRADISVGNLVIGSILLPVSFYIGSFWGLAGVCYAWLLIYPIIFIIEAWRTKVVTSISVIDVILMIKMPFMLSLIMYVSLQILNFTLIEYSHFISLIIEIVCGICIYVLGSLLINKKEVMELITIVRR